MSNKFADFQITIFIKFGTDSWLKEVNGVEVVGLGAMSVVCEYLFLLLGISRGQPRRDQIVHVSAFSLR